MKLNKRLLQIAKLVQPNSIVVDIGCDRGFLSIYLIKNKIASYAYASDVNEEPLTSAKNNIKEYQLEEKIEAVLSDGLTKFKDINFDTLVIAGMGGSLIIDILDKYLDLIRDKHLILQPNINDNGLRKYLINNNFKITNDYLVKDNDIIYDIIEVNNKKNVNVDDKDWTNLDFLIGYYNLERNDELCKLKVDKLIAKYQRLLNEIPQSNYKYQEVEKTFKELMVIKDELK